MTAFVGKHLHRNANIPAKELNNVMTCNDTFIFVVGHLMRILVYDWEGQYLRSLDPHTDLKLDDNGAVVAVQCMGQDVLQLVAVYERTVMLREVCVLVCGCMCGCMSGWISLCRCMCGCMNGWVYMWVHLWVDVGKFIGISVGLCVGA